MEYAFVIDAEEVCVYPLLTAELSCELSASEHAAFKCASTSADVDERSQAQRSSDEVLFMCQETGARVYTDPDDDQAILVDSDPRSLLVSFVRNAARLLNDRTTLTNATVNGDGDGAMCMRFEDLTALHAAFMARTYRLACNAFLRAHHRKRVQRRRHLKPTGVSAFTATLIGHVIKD